jgi:hypothetical protein
MGAKTYPYWRDLLESPAKSFGEKAARGIEERLELGRGWLDRDHGGGPRRYPVASEPSPAPALPAARKKHHPLTDLIAVEFEAVPDEIKAQVYQAVMGVIGPVLAAKPRAPEKPAPSAPPKPARPRAKSTRAA